MSLQPVSVPGIGTLRPSITHARQTERPPLPVFSHTCQGSLAVREKAGLTHSTLVHQHYHHYYHHHHHHRRRHSLIHSHPPVAPETRTAGCTDTLDAFQHLPNGNRRHHSAQPTRDSGTVLLVSAVTRSASCGLVRRFRHAAAAFAIVAIQSGKCSQLSFHISLCQFQPSFLPLVVLFSFPCPVGLPDSSATQVREPACSAVPGREKVTGGDIRSPRGKGCAAQRLAWKLSGVPLQRRPPINSYYEQPGLAQYDTGRTGRSATVQRCFPGSQACQFAGCLPAKLALFFTRPFFSW